MIIGLKDNGRRQSPVEFLKFEEVIFGFTSYLHNIHRWWTHDIWIFQRDRDAIIISDSYMECGHILFKKREKEEMEVKFQIIHNKMILRKFPPKQCRDKALLCEMELHSYFSLQGKAERGRMILLWLLTFLGFFTFRIFLHWMLLLVHRFRHLINPKRTSWKCINRNEWKSPWHLSSIEKSLVSPMLKKLHGLKEHSTFTLEEVVLPYS